MKKQLAVHMTTQANIPLTLTFNPDTQSLVSRLTRFKIDLIDYKPYFKSQVPFKALQHLFKSNGKPIMDFMVEFGRIVNRTLSAGMPLPRQQMDKEIGVRNVTVVPDEAYVKMCVQLEQQGVGWVQARRTQSLPEYELITYEYGYLLEKDNVRLVDS